MFIVKENTQQGAFFFTFLKTGILKLSMAQTSSSQKQHHWGWLVLTLIALIALAWLIHQLVLRSGQGRSTREFEEQQEIINTFNEAVTPLNSVQRREIDDTFFGN